VNRFVCIHGHFYQPPRESPWLEEVEEQPSAAPFHDWNERVTSECYEQNGASRLLDANGKLIELVNNYSKISFNFGPSLLAWMQVRAPEVYEKILEGDRKSRKPFSGHGSAIAQVYNHMIMPLANEKDRRTQVKWGIEDFRYRFGRYPEGMWLPETAVDSASLEVLAELGIKFTILSSMQAAKMKPMGAEEWTDVSDGKIDTRKPYQWSAPSGRTMSIFFYNDKLSQEVAFGGLLRNGEVFAKRLVETLSDGDLPELVNIATDGETYGHHHRHGEMALTRCLNYIEENKLAQLTDYGQFLAVRQPQDEVKIAENTSWSCPHGIERWRSDCGCGGEIRPGWRQQWRTPLRTAIDQLRDAAARQHETEASKYVLDPWEARDEYISLILDRTPENVKKFLDHRARRELSQGERDRLLGLLEIQKFTALMYASCGWFWEDLGRIETIQVLKYACRAIQLCRKLTGEDLEPAFLQTLQTANSKDPNVGNGRQVFDTLVRPGSR
jgi:alpha-amylase/alpha-mannosidase (GH57 family)